ncbi:MAG TPA: NAD(P)/FAD-dependent oxidoreductase [Candidatus Saccharimonadales bacterium]|nr:NAD(P)/FAD-dependent oxidoreductase [Candidatus Saccharimonadales bacterium]
MKYDFDLIVIGSGAGGSVGADFAANLGKKVAVFEKEKVGGECPNWACVPTKALLSVADTLEHIKFAGKFGVSVTGTTIHYQKIKAWKNLVVSRTGAAEGEEAFKNAGITLIKERAWFLSPHEVEAGGKTYSAKNFLIATGTEVLVPPIPGLKETGFSTFKEAVDFDHLPKSIFILGGGAVGLEFTQIFSTFGSEVYLAEALPSLMAREDKEVGELSADLFERAGVKVLTGTKVMEVRKAGHKKIVSFEIGGHLDKVEVDEILLASGKKPVLDIELEKAGVEYNPKQIKVNEFLLTTTPNIYAAGDIVGPYQFTHTGNYQSYIAANNIFNSKKIKLDYSAVPRCVFTSPEIAAVGLTEKEALEKKIKIKKAIVPISILGRANTSEEFDGFVKVVTDEKGILIGASIVAPSAGEMIHELTLAIKLKANASDVAEMIHAYPTFSEAIKIACANVE